MAIYQTPLTLQSFFFIIILFCSGVAAYSENCVAADSVVTSFPGLFGDLSDVLANNYTGPLGILHSVNISIDGVLESRYLDNTTLYVNPPESTITTSATSTTTPSVRKRRSTDAAACFGCCKTDLRLIIPYLVELDDGRSYRAVHNSPLFQQLNIAFCTYSGSSDCENCKCGLRNRFSRVLVWDFDLVNTEPPVRFLSVSFPGECECISSD